MVLKDRIAEDFHCVLSVVDGGKIQVDDLKSHYGTFVNGKKISRVLLNDGDELQIGFTRIEWQKLKPALLEMEQAGSGSVPSDEEIHELLDGPPVNTSHDDYPFNPQRYHLDATEQLLEEAESRLLNKELDYQPKAIVKPTENPNPTDSVEVLQTNEIVEQTIVVAEKTEAESGNDVPQTPSELPNVPEAAGIKPQLRKKAGNDFRLYYWLIAGLVMAWMTFMIWAAL